MHYIAEPNTPSKAVNKKLEQLNKKRSVPKVNLPALARRDERFMQCWLPPDDHVFISSDFSSLEPSITAEFSKDPYYTYATCTGIGKKPYIDSKGVLMIDDMYLMYASQDPRLKDRVIEIFSQDKYCELWLTDKEQIKGKILKPERSDAKPACLGFGYNMGWKRFITQSFDAGKIVTAPESKGAHKAYWQLFADIKKLANKLEHLLKRDGFMINPFGYRLTTEPHKGYNAFIQSSASGVVDVLCLKFFPTCPWAEFITLVHDEIIYSIPKDKIAETKVLQDGAVKSLNKDLGFTIPMRLDFTVAESFKEIK